MYHHDHDKQLSVGAVAQMLSTILYYRRFFPYYTFNIVAGLDEEGIQLHCHSKAYHDHPLVRRNMSLAIRLIPIFGFYDPIRV